MKHFYPIIALAAAAAIALPAAAQSEATDSVPSTELQEVVVEGVTRRIVKFGAEYTPDKKVKKAATDATRLLQLMQLPQLKVSPVSGDIKTLSGKGVSMFIDFVPATKEELEGMRTDDVLRIEILDFPDDPRFNGADHVINFIMRKYEWGGYTKLTGRAGAFGTDFGTGDIYSKFVRRRWQFDASASGTGRHNDDNWTDSRETYRDVDFGGVHYPEILRTSDSGRDNLTRSNNQYFSLRALYRTDNILMQHIAWLSRNETPYERMASRVSFMPEIVVPSEALTRASSLSFSPGVSGYYRFILPKGNTLNVSWNFSYGAKKNYSRYTLGDLDPIVNNNREKVYNPTANISYSKNLGHNNTFRTALMTYNTIYDTRYFGSHTDRQKLLSSENMLFLEYMQNWGFGLSLYSRVGMSYVIGRVNSKTTLEQWNPRLGAQLQWKINNHHSASIEGWWGNSHPQPSTSSTALVQTDELMWLQGNPDLKNTLFQQATASYTYIPNNLLSFSTQIEYERNGSKQAYDFYTLPGYDGLVRRSINSGTAHRLEAFVGANATLLNGSLVFGAQGTFHRAILTGTDAIASSWFTGTFQAACMVGNFSANVFYETPSRQLNAWTNGSIYKDKCSYGLNVGYSVGNFKGHLGFYNWFEGDSFTSRHFASRRYSIDSRQWSENCSRMLRVTLTYTIPYGKKVEHNNELWQQQGAGSAILK